MDHSTSEPAYQFPGFFPPRYTPVPDDLFDDVMAGLTGAELKVILYIIRRTFGFKKDRDRIALSQMVEGIVTRDGRRLDYGTGLSKQSVVTALKGLREKGYIVVERNSSPDRGNEPTTYSLHVRGEAVKKHDKGSLVDPREVVIKLDTQDTEQETEVQEYTCHSEPIDEGRQVIRQFVDEVRQEFKSWFGPAMSLDRAMAIYQTSGVDLKTFHLRMTSAREEARGWYGDKLQRWFERLALET